jgi:4-diphosphocytidyl-2-C-methyl-D-erythritol kinase
MMSGSGPTVFGIYDDENKARKAKEEIEAKGYAPAAFVCDFV